MLKRFEVRNYRTFHGTVIIDFSDITRFQANTDCLHGNLMAKTLIFGRNATGKTNLGRAMLNLKTQLGNDGEESPIALLNADSPDDDIFFSYTFLFGNDEIRYEYAINAMGELIKEAYNYNTICIFNINFETKNADFTNLDELRQGHILYQRYWDVINNNTGEGVRLPFLKWLLSNVSISDETHLISLADFVSHMQLVLGTTSKSNGKTALEKEYFYKRLGTDTAELYLFERFLNYMGVECHLETRSLPEDVYELYFAHEKLVPFWSTASSGTKALMELYRDVFFRDEKPSVLYLDEFDAFYHYEMAEKMVKYLKEEYYDTQVILTSHNTNLMTNRLMRPDCVMILSKNGRLTSLPHATTREIREAHNLEKMYIGGEFSEYE